MRVLDSVDSNVNANPDLSMVTKLNDHDEGTKNHQRKARRIRNYQEIIKTPSEIKTFVSAIFGEF